MEELAKIVEQVERSNDPAFGTTGTKLRDALARSIAPAAGCWSGVTSRRTTRWRGQRLI